MIPLRDNQLHKVVPYVTWVIVILNVIIYVWDRQGHLFAPSLVFADLTMRPKEVVQALSDSSYRFPLVTLFTSMFMHGNLLHIIGNIVFLVVFGPNVEAALGGWRFALYYLFWGVAASVAQIYVDPQSTVPTLGASGAIGGVLGCYFLLFPGNKVELLVPLLPFIAFTVRAWIVLGIWFLYQILIPQDGVAQWAHAGGFLAGMATVLFVGGRDKILKGREMEFEQEFA